MGYIEKDSGLLKQVREDLLWLREEWDQRIGDVSLRNSSGVLRKLLVYDELQKASNMMGHKFMVDYPVVNELRGFGSTEEITFWQAGGGLSHGAHVYSAVQMDRIPSKEERNRLYKKGKKRMEDGDTNVKLSTYVDMPSFIVQGHTISVEQVVKYIVNKLGVHYDPSREDEEDFELLDQVREGRMTADRNAVYYELLSISQTVAESKSSSVLCSEIRDYLI